MSILYIENGKKSKKFWINSKINKSSMDIREAMNIDGIDKAEV